MSGSDTIHEFLLDFRNPSPNEDTFPPQLMQEVSQGRSKLLSILGYDDDDLMHGITVEVPREGGHPEAFTFDVVAARSANAPPYLAVATIVTDDEQHGAWEGRIVHDLARYGEAIDSHYVVLFSNSCIFIRKPDEEILGFRFSELEPNDSARIYELLRAPDVYPQGSPYPAAYHPKQTKLTQFLFHPEAVTESDRYHYIEGDLFQLDLKEYSNHLYAAEQANTKNKKGDTLEELAGVLLNAINCLSVRDRNLVTKFGEIDLVTEFHGADQASLFDYHTRFHLIECKNWIDPVPAKEVGHFESKCVRTNVDLGIVFAWNGVTGQDSEMHATRMIDRSPKENPDIVVINSRDLYRILDGTSFYKILDQKLYQQRFDV